MSPVLPYLLVATLFALSSCQDLGGEDSNHIAFSEDIHLEVRDPYRQNNYSLSPWADLRVSLALLNESMPKAHHPTTKWKLWLRHFAQYIYQQYYKLGKPLAQLKLDHLFCSSDSEGTYLLYQGNRSPPFKFPDPLSHTDHLAFFVFDLDGLHHTRKIETRSLQFSSSKKRLPFLLWAMLNLDRNLTHLNQSFGSNHLVLRGKSPMSTFHGLSLPNDYSTWFYSNPLKGRYYGYDGPCITKGDNRRQHTIFALLLALPLESYHSQDLLLNQSKIYLNAWQILAHLLDSIRHNPHHSLSWSAGIFLTPPMELHQRHN